MKQILIVEDDRDIRETVAELLTDHGYSVIVAANGQDAMDYLKKGVLPHLILLDLMMPIKDGFEFRVEQQSNPALSQIPVIIMSADGHTNLKKEKTKAVDYIKKPVDMAVMLDKIRTHSNNS